MVAAYAWLSGGEIPSQRLRSYTFGIASAVGFLGAWLATFTAPYFINPESLNWGPEYGMFLPLHTSCLPYPFPSIANLFCQGWIWAPSCFITVIWVYFYLPEIKNRTLEEIDEMFEARLPARKFRKYVCTGNLNGVVGVEKKEKRQDSERDEIERHEVVGVEKTG
jgi:SP family sugar:H+ symporter-like MFS transporter